MVVRRLLSLGEGRKPRRGARTLLRARGSHLTMAEEDDGAEAGPVHPLSYPWTFTYFKKVANKVHSSLPAASSTIHTYTHAHNA